jgi:hypothetical protein
MKKRILLVNDGCMFKDSFNGAFMFDVFEVPESLVEVVFDSVRRVNVLTQRSAFSILTAMGDIKSDLNFIEQIIVTEDPSQNIIEMGKAFVNNKSISDEDCAVIQMITTLSWVFNTEAVLVMNWYSEMASQLSDKAYTDML